MRSNRFADAEHRFDSFVDFCRSACESVLGMHAFGRLGCTLVTARQPAGSGLDVEVPELVVTRLVPVPVRQHLNLRTGASSEVMPSGAFIIIPPHRASRIVVEEPYELEAIAIPWSRLLRIAGDDAGLPNDGDFGPAHAQSQVNPAASSVLDHIRAEARDGNPHGGLFGDALTLQLAAALNAARRPRANRPAGLSPSQRRRATEFLLDRLERDVSLEELAAIVDLSPFHFCRSFKLATGMTPAQWQTAQRIEKAKLLLREPGKPLPSIAAEVGYASRGAFGTAFRRITGESPAAWRRRNYS
jgi:AraC family transcriptional regulator